MERKTIIVHSGGFHADDLFAADVACTYLEKKGYEREQIDIIRTRNPELIEKGDIVLDVGGILNPEEFRFDHHQEGGAGIRENGIPYAAFGLAWKFLGPHMELSDYVVRRVDEKLVQTVDALDNGLDIFGEPSVEILHRYTLHSAIHSLHPTWNEVGYSVDDAFFAALPIVHTFLQREIAQATSEENGQLIVREQYEVTRREKPELLILDGHYPYAQVVESMPDVQFVVKPGEDGESWKARSVREGRSGFNTRKLFPEEWAGKSNEELAQITGVPDAKFVHNKRFIAVAGSKEGALALAEKSLTH
ncbi:MAG: MYG1 family protein [Candidatus Paceibacterota bacterium]